MHTPTTFSIAILLLTVGAHAQIKTSGIKTHYPAAPNSGNLVYNEHNYNANNYTAQYNRTFVPADTYQGGNVGVVSVNTINEDGTTHLAGGSHLTAGEEYHYYGAGGSNSVSSGGSYSSGGVYNSGDAYNSGGVYNGGSIYSSDGGIARQRAPTRVPQYLDATAEFINKTRSQMASGICYAEVAGKASEPTLQMQTISDCCPGYRHVSRSSAMHCEPICSEDCSNGICIVPDVCECYPGFARAGRRCEEL